MNMKKTLFVTVLVFCVFILSSCDYPEKSFQALQRENIPKEVTRNGAEQTLVDTNIGKKNYNQWLDFAEGIADELPHFTRIYEENLINPSKMPEELIEGIVRRGHKMLISGSSKAGKSFLLMQLAVALSQGNKWLGFQCKKSKVLYINLEIDPASFENRFVGIYKKLKLKPIPNEEIVVWNLRGEAMPLDKLVPDRKSVV